MARRVLGSANMPLALGLRFPDRLAAGRALAPRVAAVTRPPTLVLGIPPSGLVVAAPIAEHLGLPLAALWVRKLASPREPDVTIGAVDLDGDVTLSVETVRAEGLTDDQVAELAYHGRKALVADWERAPGLDAAALLAGADAVIVDDCLCTGLTLRAAMRWVRRQLARRVVVAVPIADLRIWQRVAHDADAAVAVEVRDDGPLARSEVYQDFRRITEDEVQLLLRAASVSTAPAR